MNKKIYISIFFVMMLFSSCLGEYKIGEEREFAFQNWEQKNEEFETTERFLMSMGIMKLIDDCEPEYTLFFYDKNDLNRFYIRYSFVECLEKVKRLNTVGEPLYNPMIVIIGGTNLSIKSFKSGENIVSMEFDSFINEIDIEGTYWLYYSNVIDLFYPFYIEGIKYDEITTLQIYFYIIEDQKEITKETPYVKFLLEIPKETI